MRFRTILFWTHLLSGVIAGIIIGVMCFTGVLLAFEKELVAWAERDLRTVSEPAPGTTRLPLEEVLARVKSEQPDFRPASVTFSARTNASLLLVQGRTNAVYVNPYSGEIRADVARSLRGFMQTMIEWHRWLGATQDGRPIGKAITGAGNVAFLFLALSGLYLWWPAKWSARALRSITLFNARLRGRARDWNWHNVIGFWSAPVLIVLTATAMPISYQWAGNLIYRMTGTEPPPAGGARGGGGGGAATASSGSGTIDAPAGKPTPLPLYEVVEAAMREVPNWDQLTVRLGNASGAGSGPGGRRSERGGREEPREGRRGESAAAGNSAGVSNAIAAATAPAGPTASTPVATPQSVTISVKERDAWPRFGTIQLTIDPQSGSILRREGYVDGNLGRRVRSWTRFLHTGEALGPIGQAIAGLASLGGVVLVWTGFALTVRRFINSRRRAAARGAATAIAEEKDSTDSTAERQIPEVPSWR